MLGSGEEFAQELLFTPSSEHPLNAGLWLMPRSDGPRNMQLAVGRDLMHA